jgi:hypothetical protein
MTYALVASNGKHLVVAAERLDALKEILGDLDVITTMPGE